MFFSAGVARWVYGAFDVCHEFRFGTTAGVSFAASAAADASTHQR